METTLALPIIGATLVLGNPSA